MPKSIAETIYPNGAAGDIPSPPVDSETKAQTPVPAAPEAPPPAPPPPPASDADNPPASTATGNFVFIKNLNPYQMMKFEDGTVLAFNATKFVTTDPKLADKIRKVAAKYRVIEAK